MIPGVAVLAYIVAIAVVVGGVAAVTAGGASDSDPAGGSAQDEIKSPARTATASPPGEVSGITETPSPSPAEAGTQSSPTTPVQSDITRESKKQRRYEQLLSSIQEVYPKTVRETYREPYLQFRGASYEIESESVTLNFSIDSLESIDRYEKAVVRTSDVYVWSHFNPETAYPETVTLNYFRNGELNATAEIKPRWMRQHIFGNASPKSYAPLSYRTYVLAVMGTLDVKGEKVEFPYLTKRCEDERPLSSEKCKSSLRNRMPVRFYLPEQTSTGSQYTNVFGAAPPNRSFDSRQTRLQFTTRQLKANITGRVDIEAHTPVDQNEVWKDVEMRVRDVYLRNETIIVEQYTRSERGDDSLPLRQNDVIGAKYGRLVVNYGARYMPEEGVIVIKYTEDGQRYSKARIPNYNAVGYINGDRSLVGLGLGVEIIEQYQEPGS
jgi:hypothetical protein